MQKQSRTIFKKDSRYYTFSKKNIVSGNDLKINTINSFIWDTTPFCTIPVSTIQSDPDDPEDQIILEIET